MTIEEKLKWYMEQEIPVFPLHHVTDNGDCSCGTKKGEKHPYGKHPCVQDGFHSATTSRDKIARWNIIFPNANWGIALGKMGKLCCVDVDPRNGGTESLKILFPNGLPETYTVKTGGNGWHFYFLYDALYCKKVKLLPGIEFLTDGQYIVIPPSNHVLGDYSVESDVPVIELPEAVKERLREPETVAKEVYYQDTDTDEEEISFYIEEGSRNDSTASYVGKLIRKGLAFEQVYNNTMEWNNAYCIPPLAPKDIKTIVSSVFKTHERKNQQSIPIKTVDDLRADATNKPSKAKIGFPSITFSEGLDRYGSAEIEWIIEDWLPVASGGFICSAPQRYKSYLSYHMAHCIATGEPFLKRFPIRKQGLVYIVQQEDHPSIFFRRMGQIGGSVPTWDEANEEFHFPVMNHPNIMLSDRDNAPTFSFHDPDTLHYFERDVLQGRHFECPTAIFLDPFYTMALSDDHFQKAAYHMQILKKWQVKYNTTIMIIHHASKAELKDTQRLRDTMLGSQLLNAFAETMIAFGSGENPTQIVIERGNKSASKYKNIKLDFYIDEYSFDTKITEMADDEPRPGTKAKETMSPVRKYDAQREAYRDFTELEKPRTHKDYAAHFKVGTTTIARNLEEFGIIWTAQGYACVPEVELYDPDKDGPSKIDEKKLLEEVEMTIEQHRWKSSRRNGV
jgi:hypothetical protein